MKLLLTLFIALLLSFGLKAQVQINNKQLKGIANPSDTTDAVNVKTVQSGNLLYATATGTNAMNLTITPAITNYNAGMIINFKCPASNTNTVTLNVNGLGARQLFKNVMDSLEAGNIRTGQMVSVIYDGNNFQLLSTPNTASLGKTFVTLSGDITDAEAATIILNEVGSNTQYINVQFCPLLTTLDLSMVKRLDYITISNNINLQSVNLSNLKYVSQGLTSSNSVYIHTNPKLSSLNLNSLQTTLVGINLSNNYLTAINLPSLNYCSFVVVSGTSITSINLGQAKSVGSITISNTSVPSINLNQLENISGGLIISNNLLLASINSSIVKSIRGNLNISSNPLLTSISLSALDSVGTLTISGNNLFSVLNLSSLKTINGNITFTNNPSFASLNLSSMNSSLGAINISNNIALTSINCANLTTCKGLYLDQDSLLSNINFDKLKTIANSYLSISYCKLSSISFPLLDIVSSYISIANNSNLTSISFDSLIGGINSYLTIKNNPLLNLIAHPNLKTFYYIEFRFNRLSTSTINDLLAFYVNITPILSGKQIQLNSQVPTAAPSGLGITNKATLISRGNTVQTD
ncbi:MAG: hypothetical protein ACOYMA_06430 [Bacteroidia bacterium]